MASRKARPRYSRSTRGCHTCRLRHLKCDESFPCRHCLSAGWQCDGPRLATDLVFRSEKPNIVRSFDAKPRQEPNLFVWLTNSQEKRAFEFYLRRAGPLLSGALDYDFWGSLIPRLAESDVTVRYIMLAISHFCEHPIRSSEDGKIQVHALSSRHVVALQWQARALSLDRQRNPQTQTSDLVLKYVLLSAHEFQQNNYRNGWKLLRVAYSLVPSLITSGCGNPTTSAASNDSIWEVLIPCMMRNLCLLFNPWIQSMQHILHLTSIEEFETEIFKHLCTVYASVKTGFFGIQSKAHTTTHETSARSEELLSILTALRAKTSAIPCTNDHALSVRCRALQEYSDIAIYWLEVVADLVNKTSAESNFLHILLEETEKLNITAPTLFPVAAKTDFFQSFAIYPTAFFITIFSRDPQLKSRALTMLNEKTNHNSMPHLLALVRKTEQHTSDHVEDVDMSGVFQIHHGNKDRELLVDEIYDGPTC